MIQLTEENFLFAIAVEQPPEYIYNHHPFYLIEVVQMVKRDGKISNITIPLERCTLEKFRRFAQTEPSELESIYNQVRYKNCIA
jgi:hypothetical protein